VDERSMQFLGGAFSGLTEEQFMAMMAVGGRSDG
jgi:protocatechuate 4,5-dioxygenase, alpha chain